MFSQCLSLSNLNPGGHRGRLFERPKRGRAAPETSEARPGNSRCGARIACELAKVFGQGKVETCRASRRGAAQAPPRTWQARAPGGARTRHHRLDRPQLDPLPPSRRLPCVRRATAGKYPPERRTANPISRAAHGAGRSQCPARTRADRTHREGVRATISPCLETVMPDPDTISADYTLRPSELAETLALLVEARQPAVVWGPPGSAKSDIAQQVAAAAGREYVDVRALLLDPVDLRGIPWRDSADRTRWAPPSFLPPWTIPAAGSSTWKSCPRPAYGPGRSLPVGARPQMRRVRVARGRVADCLRQPRKRSRRYPPHADTARIALRSSGDPGRRGGLVQLGCGQRNRGRGNFLHPA